MQTPNLTIELPLPANLASYEHQVAGHGCSSALKSDSSPIQQKPKFLYCHENRCVYKPIQAPPKGNREVEFYQTVFANPINVGEGDENDNTTQSKSALRRQKLLIDLRPFLPAFRGVYRHPETGARYMRLEDLLRDFARPSVMDVKMGARSYEPTASEEKRRLEIAKYAYRQEIGFFVTGLRVWRPATDGTGGNYERYSKRYGKDINPDNMYQMVIPPLIDSIPAAHRLRLLRLIIAQLEAILDWFNGQDLFHFYASSILIGVECCPIALDKIDRPHVLVKMVDFTHAVALNQASGNLDEGYLLGLRTLIRLCRDCEKRLQLSNGC